jgi:hypothetical protein
MCGISRDNKNSQTSQKRPWIMVIFVFPLYDLHGYTNLSFNGRSRLYDKRSAIV